MRKLTIAFFLLLSLSFVAEAQLNIDHFIRVGRTRISIGNYTGAIEYFNIVIEFKPYLPEAYLYRGIAKHSLEDYRGAIKDYNKAIELKPYYPMAYNNRGMAYHNLRRYDKAIEDYNRALEFDPDDETIYNNRGIAKLAIKDFDGAMADYDKAVEINPKSTHALMNRSNAKIVSGDVRGAIRDLNEVIIIRPHYAAAYLNRGLARFELEDYASALRDYDQAIRFDPSNALAFNNRGIVKHKLEDYQGAIIDYDMAIALNPQMASAFFNRAMAKEILNRSGYENDYQIAARMNPQFDLSNRRINTEQTAQQQQQQNQQGQQKTQQQGNNTQNTAADQTADATAQNTQKPKQQQLTPEEIQEQAEKERKDEIRRRRAAMDVVVENTRDIPEEALEMDDGRIQNKDIVIDLQPMFFISAFEKGAVDYNRFQYYNMDIDELNVKNNYDPVLSITNKPTDSYRSVYENFILFFNEKIGVQENANNYLNRGIFYSLTGNFNLALDDINKAIELDERLSLAYFSRANALFKMQEQIEEVSGEHNTVSLSMTNRNTRSSDKSDEESPMFNYNQILEDYQLTLYLNPTFFFGYFNRAYIQLKQGKYIDAVEDLNRAIELEPKFAEAYFNRGLTKIFLDDVEGGAADLSRAGELGIEGAYNIIKRYCN